jgi:hypothetical protein
MVMSDDQYFLIYTNYSLLENPEKHISFFDRYSVQDTWGMTFNIRNLLRQRFILDSNKIERQRHLLFQGVLKEIAEGISLLKIDGLGNINQETNRNKPIKTQRVTTDRKGKEKISQTEIAGPIAHRTEGERLYNLACHSLISFLSVQGNLQKIKQCPYCKLFFIAKDAKRINCYENKCEKEDRRLRKQKQRERDPVKYI